jgi:hypothetical protein
MIFYQVLMYSIKAYYSSGCQLVGGIDCSGNVLGSWRMGLFVEQVEASCLGSS